MDNDRISALVAGPLFATYSKNPEVAFDNDARMARRRELEASLSDEIRGAQAWVESAAAGDDPGGALGAVKLLG